MNSGVLWRVLRRAAIRGTMIRKQVALATIVTLTLSQEL